MEKDTNAIDLVRQMVTDGQVSQKVAEMYFPELKESEGEKWIPKEIAKYLKEKGGFRSCWLAWLEKQGEKHIDKELSKLLNRVICMFINNPLIPYSERDEVSKKIIPYVEQLEKQGEQKHIAEEVLIKAGLKPYKDGDQWCVLLGDNIQEGICGFGNTIEDALYAFLKDLIVSQSKQKPTDKPFNIEIPFGTKDSELQEASYHIPEGFHAEIEGNKVVIKKDKQKPTDKVEPEFKEGDWVFIEEVKGHKNGPFKIKIVDSLFGYSFDDYHTIPFMYEDLLSKWTIQDAKDGDVLANKHWCPLIFKDKETCWCYYSISNEVFRPNSNRWFFSSEDYLYPATKEQRDLLFQKMKEAGYEWDAEKKELRKIENEIKTSFGAKDSELQEATYYIPKGFHAEIEGDKIVIKKGEQKSAWSEENKDVINHLLAICAGAKRYRQFAGCLQEDITKYQTWLKSLKDRYAWNPSDEQMDALHYVTNFDYGGHKATLVSLYEQLKKLK